MEVEVGTMLCNETFELMDLPVLIQLRLSRSNGCRLSWSQTILNAGWWTWSERTTPTRPSGQIQEFPSHSAMKRMFLEEHGPSCVGWGGFGG